MEQKTDHPYLLSPSYHAIPQPRSNISTGKYLTKYPFRRDAKIVTKRVRSGWKLAIWYGLEYDNRGKASWDKSNLTDGHLTEDSALDEVLNMFDLDARGYWTPLTNMDEFEDDDDDGLGGITQGIGRMNW